MSRVNSELQHYTGNFKLTIFSLDKNKINPAALCIVESVAVTYPIT